MEKSSGIAYYDLDSLCTEAVNRNFRGDGNTVGSVISGASFALAWSAFTSWCDGQIEMQRAVNLPNFGTVGFQPLMNNKKVAYIRLNDNFLHIHGLNYNPQMAEFESQAQIQMGPLIKPNFAVMAKNVNMEKAVYHQTLLSFFQLIGELLNEHHNVEIDLGAHGKFQGINRQVIYAPMNKMKPQGAGKQTVKNLMDQGTQGTRGGQLPPLNHTHPAARESLDGNVYQVQTNIGYASNSQGKNLSAMLFKQSGHVTNHTADLNTDSPTRRFNKPTNEGKITAELLGAGDDPMASQQEFSLLANNPRALMGQSFKRPLKANSRFPPVIDPFSRTLAAPVSSQRHYLSVSHKIGTNYTPSGKGFYIDVETRIVRYKNVNETGTKLDIAKETDIQPADEAEEYDAVMHPQNADPRRINARRVSYNRYRQYVENEISIDVIAPIRQYWLTHIIELIPGDLHAVEKERIEQLIDTMLNEINKDYFDSVRKSILDYILKDDGEMRRLGIQQVLNQPITWGDDFYKGIEPNEEWKHNVMMARMLMSENLCICSQATLELMRIWREKDYYQMFLVQLPGKEVKPVSLEQFKNQQTNQIDKVRGQLNSEWSKSAVDILREELENLDKSQTKTFFDSVAALMSNQVRELTTKSIDNYVEFFRRFKKTKYPLPEEIIKREYDPDEDFELTFLTLKLEVGKDKDDNGKERDEIQIRFEDKLPNVRDELVKIVSTMVEKINAIPRADTMISNAEKSQLWFIQLDDEIIQNAEAEVRQIVDENLQATSQCINIYDEFLFLLQEEQRIDTFLAKKQPQRSEYLAQIQRYQETIARIRNVAPYEIRMSMFLVECSKLNEKLINMCEDLIRKIVRKVEEMITYEQASSVTTQVRNISTQFNDAAETSAKLVDYEGYLEDVKNQQRQAIVSQYNDLLEWLQLLYQFPVQDFQDDLSKNVLSAYNQTNKIQTSIESRENALKNQRDDIERKLASETKQFAEDLNDVKIEVDKFKDYSSRSKKDDYNKIIAQINQKLVSLQERMVKINQQEVDLEATPTEWPQIDQYKKAIKPYQDFWQLVADWERSKRHWESAVLRSLVPDDVEKDHKTMRSTCARLDNLFQRDKLPKPGALAKAILKEIEEFRKKLPIIRALCTEGLQARHIEQIKIVLDIDTYTGEESLSALMVEEGHKDKLEDIADTASKEFTNEKILKTMFRDWEPLEFTPSDCKGTYKLGGDSIELIQQTLDDHLIKTQTMKGSPYAKYFLDEIIKWEEMLIKTQENVEMWLKVQAVWMYLEPVFSSEDIMKQMPVEGNKFREVDKVWRRLMSMVAEDCRAYSVIKIDNLRGMVFDSYAKLEEVQKGLNQYLESKRGLFPRFFFLSDPELLEILSETKEPTKVQPFLKKCFEAIEKLEFDDERKIHAMFSSEGERVPYVKIIDPVAAKGNVEEWLRPVEEVMIKSVKDVVDKANLDYSKPGQEREKWVTQWQGQAVLAVSMMKWTSQAEEAMKKSGIAGLEVFYEKQNKQLNGIVGVVRTNISRLQRATLEALVVLDVHARDVIKQDLIDAQVSNPTEFAWLAQLRYYWEENDLWVKITNSTLSYNYEYLGNSARLVITPLTDRCYRTLCGALFLNYGGAPEGPAGTGKTETVKDLSKALARQCIVFNCSDSMDFNQMGKMFKGLASCGAWSCFDEFNRIDLEVLSVIAQQLQSIQLAIEKKLHVFKFEGVEIPIKWTCNCFITMNPGYAGRSELPDNLKALFRTVAMMVPDYAMIAEISLYSFGFTSAKELSQKIVTVYTLCSEQLSSQDHYDYGMRAVKSVLTAAGNLKRKYIDQNESELMLRAIKDVNLAKFLAPDIPLFKNITSDLFPGIKLPEPDYDQMLICMKNMLQLKNLQGTPYVIEKIIQLYEMITVRHGLMVVGDPFAGKTSAIQVLAGALTQLNEKGLMEEMKTHIQVLNPKSITMSQLYGFTDPVSKDWTDGILAVWFRTLASQMDTKERRWLVFDGPVDAIWIENMNTVLDDNKKLCLNSGEIIQMSANMSMIFEPMDLAVASPATVSRCGMVYMQPMEVGWRPFYNSWKNNLPAFFHKDEKNKETYLPAFDELMDVVIQPIINFVRFEAKETTPTNDQMMINSFLRLWRSLLKVFDTDGFGEANEKKVNISIVDSCFVWAATWSLLCTIDTQYRKPIDAYFKKVCNGEIDGLQKFNGRKILPGAMDRGTVYDYVYFPDKNEWKAWLDLTNKDDVDKFPKEAQVQEIIVTTVDKIRYSYIQEYCIQQQIPTLLVGPTGTGKSVYIQNVLLSQLDRAKFLTIEIGFSAQTHCNMVQDIIDLKLDKIRSGIFGPRLGMKCVIFVDDLNMPKKESYGAQPPIEILRQFCSQGGWYDYKDKKHPFRTLQDCMIIAAMGPPGGGKAFITPRFQRHFNVVAVATFDENSMRTIFSSLLKWYFRIGNFSQEVANLEPKIVAATLQIYKQIQEDLRPTPLKSHYTFNLRDVSKVICGICLTTKKEVPNSDVATRLWAHEITRVLGDRLINDEDRMWMMNAVKDAIRAPFGSNFDILFKHLDNDKNGKIETLDEYRALTFGDIFTPFGMPERPYEEILDGAKLQIAADEALAQYNNNSDKPMNLVMFSFAIEHLLRIGRILKQPGGHALLVGVGGSGRQSLTRLASKITDFEIFQIEIKKVYRMIEFREDIKSLLRSCGGKGAPTTLIFTDNSIKEEAFLEDINNILNTGEVPNIFPPDEKAEVQDSVRTAAKQENRCPEGTPQQLFSYFVERCKKNLHIVLAFSPIGDSFRNRIRNFPSLVNCTTIDWFSEWPKDALESVAVRFLGEIEMQDDVRKACVTMVQTFHTQTEASARKFKQQLKRTYYVTPTSYLELISTFKILLEEKRKEVEALRDRYANGYDCLIKTEGSVSIMQAELEAKQPMLIQTSKEVEIKAAQVEKEASAAEIVAQAVGKDEAVAQEAADAANAIKMDCQKDLDAALPLQAEAMEAAKKITKNDTTMMKTIQVPHKDVLVILSGVCVLMEVAPEKKMDPATQKRVTDYWGPAQKMMGQSDFLDRVVNYKSEELTEKLINGLQTFLEMPCFNKEYMMKINPTAANFAAWAIAMKNLYQVNLIVKPKQAQLAEAMAKYNEVNGVLKIKQAELKVIMDKVNGLRRELKQCMDDKAQLEADVADCEAKLIRAKKLISGLGGQKTLWQAMSEKLAITYINLTGDVLISSGMIAYLGAFNSVFRDELAAQWVKACQEKKIPNSGAFSLSTVLGDPVLIRNWTIQGLPSDAFSIENAIITMKTQRWPLFIDPQGQANKWIRTLGKEKGIKIMKFTEEKYLKFLEASIRQGNPVLIENVGEELDPAIEPLLQKQIIKRGSSYTIKIGDSVIDYNREFRFYMTTKLRNPHYLPEVSTKVTILNFMITYEGLTDQLLGIVVAKENPDLETKKEQLVLDSAKFKAKLQETENQILTVLKESKDILGDASAIEILSAASVLTIEIEKKQEIAKVTEAEIDESRIGYKPIALRTAGLFFCIQDMCQIDPMYQYSLPFFVLLFVQAIADAPLADELDVRSANLNKEFLSSLYRNICRSLFEKDKMIFSFLLCIKLNQMAGEVQNDEFRFLLTGGVALGDELPEIPAPWITEAMWGEITRACKLPGFKGFYDHFVKNVDVYKGLLEAQDPAAWEFPQNANLFLNQLRKLIILRAIRPDKLVPAISNYVISYLGPEFMQPPPFDLPNIWKDSSSITPLIFVLSPGSDPLNALQKFGEAKKKSIEAVSLGQGQGEKAENAIKEAMKSGNWVVLQNCHLAVSWMGTLERICEELSPDPKLCHRDFRLWLTSYPSPNFPVAVLQNGVKMTNEAPKGLRSNVSNSFLVDPISNKDFFNGTTQPKKFRKLLFCLCFFHAVIQERRLYGPLGWNIRYEFNETDLRISVKQLAIFIDDYPDKTPFDALRYLTGECNYGGRVTEALDRRTLMVFVNDYYQESIFDDDYKFSPSGIYYAPKHGDYESYIEYAKSLPQFPEPEIFGFHANAAITKNMNETNATLDSILLTQAQAGGSGDGNQDATVNRIADSILKDVPLPFNIREAEKKFPVRYEQSMNTVLTQELTRYNTLINTIRDSMVGMKKAIKGEVLLSPEMEVALNQIVDGKVPALWLKKCYPSLKPLGGFIRDLKDRLDFFQKWVDTTIPDFFWINRFYFTHGFLTGARQNYARKYQIAIDTMDMDFEVVHDVADIETLPPPAEGIHVYGMWLEGCKWDAVNRVLGESDPKILYSRMVPMWFKPVLKIHKNFKDIYECPLYKTTERRGVLSTTGHSTNFCLKVHLPSSLPQSHWIKRGVAMVCSLND